MFGHVLRSGESTRAAYLSFRFACLTCKGDYKGRRGAHCSNLFDINNNKGPSIIKRQFISNKVLKLTDIDNLVQMAHNRVV